MKHIYLPLAALIAFSLAPLAHAQNHAEVGVFANYFRLHQPESNFGGLGGRAAVNATSNVQFEAEMAYDFEQVFTEGFTNPTTQNVTFQRSNLRILHGFFGP